MDTSEIELVSMSVQIKGNVYFVALSQEKLLILASLAASLSDKGTLPVVPAPEGTTLGPLR
jgi:hypothetical protein